MSKQRSGRVVHNGLAYMIARANCPAGGRLPDDLLLTTLHSLSAKLYQERCHRHVAAFQPSSPSCSDRRLHDDREGRQRRPSGLYNLMFTWCCLPELHYYTTIEVQGGRHFRHPVCWTRHLTMLMGNANLCVWPVDPPISLEMETASGSVLGTTNLAGCRKILAETQGPFCVDILCVPMGQDLPPRYGRQ